MVWWEWDISFLSLLVYCKFPFMFLFINISKKGSFVWLFCIVNWILLLSWFNIDSNLVLFNFCSIRVFFHIHWPFTGHQGKGKGGDHSDTYLQLCMWDDYNAFSMATLVYTRLLLDKIYHLVELPFDWLIDWLLMQCLFISYLDDLILGFCYSNLTQETGGFELASTITLVLQAKRLLKCASHPPN